MSIRKTQKEQRYEQILMIALDEFISKGYYGTSTREIAKKANISSGLMFHYFESKLALYEKLIEIGCDEMGKWTYSKEENIISQLQETVAVIFDNLNQNPNFCKMFVFMDLAQRAPEISETVTENLKKQNIIDNAIQIFIRAQELGQIRSGNPEALAATFFGTIQVVAQMKAEEPDAPIPEAEWIVDMIRNHAN